MPRPATSPRPGKLSESGAKETGAESPQIVAQSLFPRQASLGPCSFQRLTLQGQRGQDKVFPAWRPKGGSGSQEMRSGRGVWAWLGPLAEKGPPGVCVCQGGELGNLCAQCLGL